MNEQPTTLTTIQTAIGDGSFEAIQKVAKELSASGLMGKPSDATPAAVFGLMLLCQCDGVHPVQAMRRYHIIEGKPSMRADAMLADFLNKCGNVIWHVRADDMVAATFFARGNPIDDKARDRALKRFEALWNYDAEPNPDKRSKLMLELAKLSHDGEETILRTYADCEAKGLTQGNNGATKTNWAKSPRQMLTARCITEGIRLVMPGLIAGIYESDEVRDFTDETSARTAQTDRAESDIAHMKATVEEYRKKALDTSDPTEKRRLLGLASDLAGEVQMLEDKSVAKPVKSETAKAAGTVPDGDDVPMKHDASGKPAIEAKIDHVEPPAQKATAAARSRAASEPKPEPGPFGGPEGSAPAAGPAESQTASSSASPEPEWMSEPLPTPDNWKEYRIRKVTAPKWFGKKLGELAENEISALWRKRGEPLLNSQDIWFQTEAKYIKMAWEAQGKK